MTATSDLTLRRRVANDTLQARSSLEIVTAARQAVPGSFWEDPRWNEQFIAALGGQLLKFER